MISLDFKDGHFVITASVLDRDTVNQINGLKANGSTEWRFDPHWPIVVDAVTTVQRFNGSISVEAESAIRHATNRNLELLKDKEQHYESRQFGGKALFPEQETDAHFFATRGNGLILNDMRTGKTFTLLRTLDLLNLSDPVLILCKPSIVFEWVKQINEAFPEKTVTALSSGMTAAQRKKSLQTRTDFVVCGYNLAAIHSRLSNYGGLSPDKRNKEREKGCYEDKELNDYGFVCIVVDEAHRIKDPKAASTRAAWWLGDHAEHRFVLTGTPTPNSEDELWSLLRFVDPVSFPAKSKWLNKYVLMQENFFGILECKGWNPDTKAIWDKVFGSMHVRRERTRGPLKEFRTIPIELSSKQAKAYKQFAKDAMAEISGQFLTATDSMSLNHRLSQLSVGMLKLSADGKIIGLEAPSSKVETLLDVLEESTEKAIVVSVHRTVLDYAADFLREKGYKVVSFVGGMNDEQRKNVIENFNNGSAQVICINAAGAEGIDLPAAKRIIYLQRSFDLVFNQQTEDRASGPAQTAESVEIIDIVAKDTLEEACYEAWHLKDARLHENMKDVNWIRRKLNI